MQDAPQIWKSDSERERPKDVVRSAVRAPILYRITSTLFVMVLAMVLVLVVAANPGTQYPYEWPRLLVCAVGGILLALLLMKLVSFLPAPTKVGETLMAVVLLAALVALQVYVAGTLRLEAGDATRWGSVVDSAQQYVLYGEVPGEHFLYFPWDAGVYTLLCGFFGFLRIFGLQSFSFAAVLLNIAAIDAAVWMMYRAARGVFGGSRALFLLGSMLLFAPLFLYALIPCAQTLVLPFVAAQVLLWQRARKSWRAGDVGKSTGLYCFISGLAALGTLVHVAAAFVWFAVSLDLLLMLRGRGRVRMLLGGVAVAAVVFVGGFFAMRYSSLLPRYNYADGSLPASYWVYSGLSVGEESYAADLAEISSLPNKASRQGYVQQGIRQRVGEMGAGGMLRHVGKKMAYTYGDGTYGAPAYLKDAQDSYLLRFVTPNDKRFEVLAYYSFVWQAAVLFWAMVSGVKSFLRKNDYFSFARLAILLYMVYMLVVQVTPRDVLPMVPLLLLCALEAGPIRSPADGADKQKDEVKIPVPDEDFEDVVHPTDRPRGSLYDPPAAAAAQAVARQGEPPYTGQGDEVHTAQQRAQRYPSQPEAQRAPYTASGPAASAATVPAPGYSEALGHTPPPASGISGRPPVPASSRGEAVQASGYAPPQAYPPAQGYGAVQAPGYASPQASVPASGYGGTQVSGYASPRASASAQGYGESPYSGYSSAQDRASDYPAAPAPGYTQPPSYPPAQAPSFERNAWAGQDPASRQAPYPSPQQAQPGGVPHQTDDWMRRTPPPRDTENWMRTPVPRRRQEKRNPNSQYYMPRDDDSSE